MKRNKKGETMNDYIQKLISRTHGKPDSKAHIMLESMNSNDLLNYDLEME